MTATFINQTSRVAIAGRVVELQRQSRSLDEWIPAGDYHLPFEPGSGPHGSGQVAVPGLIHRGRHNARFGQARLRSVRLTRCVVRLTKEANKA
jgi:hypothetical protein